MFEKSGGTAVSESTITNHGGIESMSIPAGFAPVKATPQQQEFNYLEFKQPNSNVRICYEQASEALMEDDIEEMERIFSETFSEAEPSRLLNIHGEEGGPDDGLVYGALCQCFVYGGALGREGSVMDMDKCKWEMRTIGGTTRLVAKLKFIGSNGAPSKREALMVMPTAPTHNGCGYIWLEGTYAEIRSHEQAFFNAIANGTFRRL
ncbi:hypothetical protein KF728_14270 [Candidatus Obscuribacterales bacterium]|nr:hypothetical protein [Candidatus Obscuribacterales bacterium]